VGNLVTPALDLADRSVMADVAAPVTDAAIRICVVDDQRLFRETLARMLAGQPGMVVVGEAHSGEEGIRLALTTRSNLVLMDIGMPGMDGLEATRGIKAADPSIQVIAVTAYPSEGVFYRALEAGVDSFVLKDASLEDLVSAIRLTHGGHRLFDGSLVRGFIDGRRGAAQLPYGLTPREMDVLQLLAAGHSNRGIAAKLSISEKTVRNHISNIYAKLAVNGRAQAVLFAVRNRMVRAEGGPSGAPGETPRRRH